MTDDRSNRLRRKRRESKERAVEAAEQLDEADEQPEPDETLEQSETSKPSKLDETEQTDEQDEADERSEGDEQDDDDDPSVKDERVGTYMYLPEEQKKRIQREYNRAKADYEFEFDDDLEKNRHWYPLVAEYGLDGLSGWAPSDIRNRLSEHGWL